MEDTHTVLSVLPNEEVGLIGIGYGGLVAWNVSLQDPHKVKKLILIGTIPQKKYIPSRFIFLLRWTPQKILLLWRGTWTLSRLRSIEQYFPKEEPRLPTLWLLAIDDPFHHWKNAELPKWSSVVFDTYTIEKMQSSNEWIKKTKVFLEENSKLR